MSLGASAICADPIPGREFVELPAEVKPDLTRRTVSCPAGKVILSGGASGINNPILNASIAEPPSSTLGYRWSAIVRSAGNPSSGSSVGVSAICAPKA